jgi:hypothetical protein
MCVSVVSVVCCQVEVSATGRSLVQSGPTECGASECDLETSTIKEVPAHYGLSRYGKKKDKIHFLIMYFIHVM